MFVRNGLEVAKELLNPRLVVAHDDSPAAPRACRVLLQAFRFTEKQFFARLLSARSFEKEVS